LIGEATSNHLAFGTDEACLASTEIIRAQPFNKLFLNEPFGCYYNETSYLAKGFRVLGTLLCRLLGIG
jgi:hypothetical protein